MKLTTRLLTAAALGLMPAMATAQETAEAPTETTTPASPRPEVLQPETVASRPAPVKPAPVVRKVTAGDRLKIIGLSRNAEAALRENRLMSPPGDNAYGLYQQILKIDPNNVDATSGLRSIASRYVAMADRAIDLGELEKAETYVDRARQADDEYAGIRAIEERLGY